MSCLAGPPSLLLTSLTSSSPPDARCHAISAAAVVRAQHSFPRTSVIHCAVHGLVWYMSRSLVSHGSTTSMHPATSIHATRSTLLRPIRAFSELVWYTADVALYQSAVEIHVERWWQQHGWRTSSRVLSHCFIFLPRSHIACSCITPLCQISNYPSSACIIL